MNFFSAGIFSFIQFAIEFIWCSLNYHYFLYVLSDSKTQDLKLKYRERKSKAQLSQIISEPIIIGVMQLKKARKTGNLDRGSTHSWAIIHAESEQHQLTQIVTRVVALSRVICVKLIMKKS